MPWENIGSVNTGDMPDDYVGNCERALEVFNDCVDWYKLKAHYESQAFPEDDEYDDDVAVD